MAPSLAMNPSSRGMPAIDAEAATASRSLSSQPLAVRSRNRGSRGSSSTWRVPNWWSTMPTAKKADALNRPWATSMTVPALMASSVPMPNTATRKPSWLTVPWARSTLRSWRRNARTPATTMVVRPTVSTTGRHQATRSAYAGARRATRYTPAFTMVAAWR